MDEVSRPLPSAPAASLDRRTLLSTGAVGISALVLPTSLAAASDGQLQADGSGLAAPTGVTAQPIGYVSGASTGAIRVSWSEVAGADAYDVGWATTAGASYERVSVGDVLTHDLIGLAGTDTAHRVVVRAVAESATSLDSDAATSSPVIAAGGTISVLTGDGSADADAILTNAAGTTYIVHTFTSEGSFTLNRAIDVQHLVVGGGGGGGSRHGGGGGGGGVLSGSGSRGTDGEATSATVTVGDGGLGPEAHTNSGVLPTATAGQASSVSAFDLSAPGGGAGGGSGGTAGGTGGSGGGSANASSDPGSATGPAPVIGNSGGRGTGAPGVSGYTGGGGGGAGTAGGNGQNVGTISGGAGGNGRASVIASNFAGTYAGGGGGSTSDVGGTGGAGGTGGGGDGATGNLDGSAGIAALGGGGGGGGYSGDQNRAGGDGGSGVVILRYALPTTTAVPAAPSGLTVLPAGHTGTGGGAVEVTWDEVAGATYTVEHRPRDVGAWSSTGVDGATRAVISSLDPALTYEARVIATVGGVTSRPSASVASGTVIATGGSIATFTGNGTTVAPFTNVDGATYVVHTFTTVTPVKTFALARTIDVDYLVVAGGGGGGSRHGGGGGAGGLLSGTIVDRTAGSNSVVVGAGGAGMPAHLHADRDSSIASAGGPSTALGRSAAGGGRGGGSSQGNGGDGGSGGGPSGAQQVGLATSGQGSNGGIGIGGATGPWAGGGGGGAAQVGGSATTSPASAGSGGDGRSSVIAGNSPTVYAGGGGGSTSEPGYAAGSGGAGGGGAGALGDQAGVDGTAHRGGGGGAGGFSGDNNRKGGDGGSGIVILRYRLPS